MLQKIWITLILFLLFCGCSNDRENFINNFAQGCMYSLNHKQSDIICKCYGEYLAEQFTDQELHYMKIFEKRMPITLEEAQIKYSITETMSEFENYKHIPLEAQKYISKCLKKHQ